MNNYNKTNLSLARELRKNMTKQEKRLWYDFLSGYPVKFRRQTPIDRYIADFYCPEAKLIVEVDGRGHLTQQKQAEDAERTATLEQLGISVLRVPNDRINEDFHGMCVYIDEYVKILLGGK